jgi:acetyl-CoA acyltransferase
MASIPTESQAVIIGGVRSPFVRARGVFKNLPASTLGGIALRETVARSGLAPTLIDEVYFGIVSGPTEGTNVAREALFDSGLPAQIPCTTINRYCASSAEALAGIVAKIESGQIQAGLAGGVESISSVVANFSLEATDFFQSLATAKTTSQRLMLLKSFRPNFFMPLSPGIKEPTTGLTMGQSADLMAREFKISRKDQDTLALRSHQRAAAAWEKGFYQSHVVPVSTDTGKMINQDTDVRKDSSIEKLSKLRAVFYEDGTITAGNASPLTDGSSCCLVTSYQFAQQHGLKPLGRIRAFSAAAINVQTDPLLIAPVYAIPKVLAAAKITWNDIDLIEMHEAFAGQVLATISAIESKTFAQSKLGLGDKIGSIDMTKFNLNGGSIAIGHPFGATGVRLVLQALHQLKAMNKSLGLITICAAGGLGMALVIEAFD